MVYAIRHASSRLVATGLGLSLRPVSQTTVAWRNLVGTSTTQARYAARLKCPRSPPRRTYRHLANSEHTNNPSQGSTRSASSRPKSVTTSPGDAKQATKTASDSVALEEAKKVSDKEQRLTDWAIVRKLAGNIWPSGPGSTEIKIRVVGALGLLVAGKVKTRSDVRLATPY